MSRKTLENDERANERVVDAGRAESPINVVDPEVQEEFEDAQRRAGSGPRLLEKKLKEHTSTGPDLAGGDIDADWEDASDVGEEAAGGGNPTPDQSVVQDIGEALGNTQEDEKPLRTADQKYARKRLADLPK